MPKMSISGPDLNRFFDRNDKIRAKYLFTVEISYLCGIYGLHGCVIMKRQYVYFIETTKLGVVITITLCNVY